MQGLQKKACSNKQTGGIKIAKVAVVDPAEMRPEGLKKILETPLPLSQGLDEPPPPPPISEDLDLLLSIVAERQDG